jgi:hypothetical protein
MSSRNPFGDTTRGAADDRNTTGSGGSSGSTSGGTTGGSSSGGGGRDRDDDDDDPRTRNPLGDTSRGRTDDRREVSADVRRPSVAVGGSRPNDLPRTPDDVGGADFREDTVARDVAETISELGADVGLGATRAGLDAVGAPPGPDRRVVERVGESVGRVPGDAVGTGVSVAQAFNEVAGAGAREGPAAAVTEARDITADTVDRGLAATDRLVDIDRERRREGEGAAVQVEEGRREDAAVTATVSALSLAGGSAVQSATGLGLRSAASRVGPDTSGSGSSSTGVEADPVPSGRSDVGTGGVDQVLDPDTVDARAGADTVDVGDTSVDTGGRPAGDTSPDTGSLPLEDAIGDAGGVRTMLDEQRAGVRDFLDDERAQAGLGRQREPTTPDADPTRPDDAGGTFADVRQDALTQLQDDLGDRARRPDPGNFDGGPDPVAPAGGGGRRGTIDPETGEVDLGRSRGPTRGRDTDTDTAPRDDAAGASPTGLSAAALGAGLGAISPVNDPSGIVTDGVDDGAGPVEGVGVEGAGLGETAGTTDPTGITPDTGLVAGSGSSAETAETELELVRAETGLRSGVETGQETRADTAQRSDTRTGFGTETGAETDGRVNTETRTGTETGIEGGIEGGAETGINIETRLRLDRIDIPTFGGDDDEEDAPPLAARGDIFPSGIAGPEDFGVGLGSGDPFRL